MAGVDPRAKLRNRPFVEFCLCNVLTCSLDIQGWASILASPRSSRFERCGGKPECKQCSYHDEGRRCGRSSCFRGVAPGSVQLVVLPVPMDRWEAGSPRLRSSICLRAFSTGRCGVGGTESLRLWHNLDLSSFFHSIERAARLRKRVLRKRGYDCAAQYEHLASGSCGFST